MASSVSSVLQVRLLAAADQQAGTGITLPSGVTLSALGAAPGTPRPAAPQQLGLQGPQLERRSFPCFICGKEFGYPHHMRRHVETVHTLYPSYVFCPECGRVYKNKNSLSVHMSMYHNSQRRAAQREQALQAAAQAQAQAAVGAWQADMSSMATARQAWPAE
ncbi:Protein abrupt [Amphibalanus amphitrite]|uniref:Protein abrupt n=1 Tax=Amphibalanus amphitrite TaxID=1232801 RepID=A0A6A4WZY3_AMPAM|nr:Protein abrupt [Amphibalanus amphitrite]